MNIQIISVGSKPSAHLASMLDDYIVRLPRFVKLKWSFIKHGSGDVESSKQQESEGILRFLTRDVKVILLDETGTQYTSENFSKIIFDQSKDVVFIIGGAYGVSTAVKERADIVMSISELVLPHQLVRLILAEQIYRAYTISINHPYHHS